MNLNNYTNRNELLIEWLLESVPRGAAILDVGANDGSFCPGISKIAAHAGLFAGVDPDSNKLARHPLLQQRYPVVLEQAAIRNASFDCVYAIYVLEHVEDDRAFLASVARVRKPGGMFLFITPNCDHYFAAIAGALARLGIQERVLRMLRPSELVRQYHYPALYRLNRARKLARFSSEFGFAQCEFRYSEHFDEIACYFPGPLKIFPWLWERIAEISRNESLLGNLMGKMVKARE